MPQVLLGGTVHFLAASGSGGAVGLRELIGERCSAVQRTHENAEKLGVSYVKSDTNNRTVDVG